MFHFLKTHRFVILLFFLCSSIAIVSDFYAFRSEPKPKSNFLHQPSVEQQTSSTIHISIAPLPPIPPENFSSEATESVKKNQVDTPQIPSSPSTAPTPDPVTNTAETTHNNSPDPTVVAIPVTLIVPGTTYDVTVPKKNTVYNLMVQLKEQNGLVFESRNYGSGLGYLITEINGIKNDGRTQRFWIYYINGKKATIGVSNYIIQPEDVITWKYEKEES